MPAVRMNRRAMHACRTRGHRRAVRKAGPTVGSQPNPGAAGTSMSPRAQKAIKAQKSMP